MALVAGIDSSTPSCQVVVRDADTGELVRSGRARHPDGTEVDPQAWWQALLRAVEAAGGLADGDALARSGGSSTTWWPWTSRAVSCGRRCGGTTPGPPRRPAA